MTNGHVTHTSENLTDAVFGVKASLVTDWDSPKKQGKPAKLTYDFRIPKQDSA
jgi:hypothetical protein